MDLPIDTLPPEVVDTYRDYKRRQKILVAWLQQHGGLRADRYAQSRNPNIDLKLNFADMERLTLEVVAKQVEIPNDVLYSAQTMLRMRKEVATHYEVCADDGHELAISKFEQIIGYLKTLPCQSKSIESLSSGPASPERIPPPSNRFANLPTVDLPGLGPDYEAFQKLSLTQQSRSKHSKTPSKIPQAPSDPVARIQTLEEAYSRVFGSPLSMLRVQTRCAFKICARAGQGKLPLHIAAYLVERVFLGNFASLTGALRHEDAMGDPNNLDGTSTLIGTVFDMFNNRATKRYSSEYSLFDKETEFTQPFEALRSLWSSCEIDDKRAVIRLDPQAKRVPYKELLRRPGKNASAVEYYTQIAKDIMLEYHISTSANYFKLPLASANRLVEMVSELQPAAASVYRIFWSHSMFLLYKTAQSYEYGFVEGLAYPENKFLPPPNCRIKLLSFVQEVSKALQDHMPTAEPSIIGYSTFHNLGDIQVGINQFLKDRRFDCVTQHPMFAGSDILMVLDHLYSLGFQLLAHADIFLGPLHIYNALYQLGVLGKEIPLFEALCNQFFEAAFYGSRPTKKFLKLWKLLDDLSNISQSSRQEAKLLISSQSSRPLTSSECFRDLVMSERGQWMFQDSVQGYNKRFKAEDHSFFHRIFNQKEDVTDSIKVETIQQILGEDVVVKQDVCDGKAKSPHAKAQVGVLTDEAHAQMRANGVTSGVEQTLMALEDALVNEFSGPFPLISANLLKVWQSCYSIMARVVTKDHTTVAFSSVPAIREVLSQCDELAAELRQCGDDSAAKEAVLSSDNLKKKYSVVRRWKRSFLKEYDGTILADYQWKNL